MADHRYRLDKHLIVVPVTLVGLHTRIKSEFILDTGATFTMIDHSIADLLGYSARDASGFTTVASAVGRERGYRLVIKGFAALGRHCTDMNVACHDLKQQGVEGLIGMNFLEHFDWCLRPHQQVISIAN